MLIIFLFLNATTYTDRTPAADPIYM